MKGSRCMLERFRVSVLFLAVAPLLILQACRKDMPYKPGDEDIFTAVVSRPYGYTRSTAPDEDRIWDINFYVTDTYGSLTAHRFLTYPNGRADDIPIEFNGLKNVEYNIFALANIGYDLGVHNEAWIREWKLYLRYPEGNLRGMPMCGVCRMSTPDISTDAASKATKVHLNRMMAKITLIYDDSHLSPGIMMTPGDARICNCPRCAYAYRQSSLESGDDIFPVGYTSKWVKNRVDLYMLENTGWTAPDAERSSYIEISFDYESSSYISTGRGLIYRFYMHESGDGYGVSRNGHYIINIQPEGTGLNSQDPFRTDTSNLKKVQ